MSFFDIVLDFILMDAFEDLENPPSSVLAVLRNRWLSDSFKETVRTPAHPHAPHTNLTDSRPCARARTRHTHTHAHGHGHTQTYTHLYTQTRIPACTHRHPFI